MLIFHYSEFHLSLFHDHQVNDGNKEQGHNITRKFGYLSACTRMYLRTRAYLRITQKCFL